MAPIDFLGGAADPRLRELAESTSSVFRLLRPWCLSENTSSTIFTPIRIQACGYAKAVDLSITAAQSGFNFCEEVISFAEILDSTNEAQRQEYLRHMHAVARQGVENAGLAHDCFRDVRITIEQLLKRARKETQNIGDQLNELENGIATLEQFSACIQLYISCWNRISMDQKSQEKRHEMLVCDYNTIRQIGVLNTWKNLRQEYVSYKCTTQFIQDGHPEFWAKLKKLNDYHNRIQTPPSLNADSSKYHCLKHGLKRVFTPRHKK